MSVKSASYPLSQGFGSNQLTLLDLWTECDAPASNVRATVTRAAGAAGVRHVLKRLVVTVSSGSSGSQSAIGLNVHVRDGPSGGE